LLLGLVLFFSGVKDKRALHIRSKADQNLVGHDANERREGTEMEPFQSKTAKYVVDARLAGGITVTSVSPTCLIGRVKYISSHRLGQVHDFFLALLFILVQLFS
jgi:hypothetical protein